MRGWWSAKTALHSVVVGASGRGGGGVVGRVNIKMKSFRSKGDRERGNRRAKKMEKIR